MSHPKGKSTDYAIDFDGYKIDVPKSNRNRHQTKHVSLNQVDNYTVQKMDQSSQNDRLLTVSSRGIEKLFPEEPQLQSKYGNKIKILSSYQKNVIPPLHIADENYSHSKHLSSLQQQTFEESTITQRISYIKGSKVKGQLIKSFSKPTRLELSYLPSTQNNQSLPKQSILIDVNTFKDILQPLYQPVQTERQEQYKKKHGNFKQNKLFNHQLDTVKSFTRIQKYKLFDHQNVDEPQHLKPKKNNLASIGNSNQLNLKLEKVNPINWKKLAQYIHTESIEDPLKRVQG